MFLKKGVKVKVLAGKDKGKDGLEECLKHDIWWDSKKCLKLGLVDEIK